MTAYTATEIAGIIRGEMIRTGSPGSIVKELITDSRKVVSASGVCFFAIPTRRNDGHKYIGELYDRGVRNFVVSLDSGDLPALDGANIIRVDNTLSALQMLAAKHRRKFSIPVLAITGSNGKTIIKEWLYQLLAQDKKIIRSPKSYNSQIGVPLSVWQMQEEHELAIFEAGISEPDEMEKLQQILQPTLGIFTNIGHAHDKNFINLAQKVGEKLKLFTKVGTLIYCSDYFEIQDRIIRSELSESIRFFSWSRKLKADLVISSVTKKGSQSCIRGIYRGTEHEITIPFTDEASIENAIHCWAFMLLSGYPQKLIAERMQQLTTVAMRLELKSGINSCSVINDSYNSDINSLSIALDFLLQQNQHQKRTLILSDILQSSLSDDELYSEVARLVSEKGISRFIGIGPAIRRHAALFSGDTSFFDDTAVFLRKVPVSSFHNEAILIKGARIFEFEQISMLLQQKAHETVLEINLNALVHNLNYYSSQLRPGTRIMAMVKAFSYGSGSYEIANVLQYHQVDYLAVAYADEGVELRKSGISLPIMVMNPEPEGLDLLLKYSLEPEVFSFRILNLLTEAMRNESRSDQRTVNIHIKLDTGMHRLGFDPQEAENLIEMLADMPRIRVCSVFTHLAAADDPRHDDFTSSQIANFSHIAEKFRNACHPAPLFHISNSSAATRFQNAAMDMVRLGIGLYGISHDKREQEQLQNVTTLRTVISQIKDVAVGETVGYGRLFRAERITRIAVIPIGYADGLSRRLGNGHGRVYINGHPAPIIGAVCMDMCMADITGMDAHEGDDVFIFNDHHSIREMAARLDTIPYEVLTSVSGRVKRIYYYE
jgi:Alr-MurF fusion protein